MKTMSNDPCTIIATFKYNFDHVHNMCNVHYVSKNILIKTENSLNLIFDEIWSMTLYYI